MNYETWAATYKPVTNSMVEHAPYNGTMFETYGDEFEELKRHPVEHIWTLRDESGASYITAGIGWVNRMGYFITAKPWTSVDEAIQLSEEVECKCYKEEGYGPYTFPNGWEYYEDGDRACQECEGSGLVTKWLD